MIKACWWHFDFDLDFNYVSCITDKKRLKPDFGLSLFSAIIFSIYSVKRYSSMAWLTSASARLL